MKARTKVAITAFLLGPLLIVGFVSWFIYCGVMMGWNAADVIGEEIAK